MAGCLGRTSQLDGDRGVAPYRPESHRLRRPRGPGHFENHLDPEVQRQILAVRPPQRGSQLVLIPDAEHVHVQTGTSATVTTSM